MKKSIQRLIQNKYLFFLSCLSIVMLGSVIRYALRTYKVPEWDEQHYMRMATEFYRLIKYHLSINTPYEMLQVVPFRQPGYPLLILPFLFIFGLSKAYFWGIFTNGLLYVGSIFGIYFLSRNFLSRPSSFLASLLFAFYGWTLLHLHLTYSETASSAFTIWTILFLVKSNLFKNRKYSILFGVFLGLGLLVRWIILEYIFGVLIFIILSLVKDKFSKKKIFQNAGMSFLIALALSVYPYFQNRYWIFQYFNSISIGSPVWQALPAQETNPFSIYSLTFYLNTFAQLGIFFFILIIIGFILAFKKKNKLKPILFTAVAGYLFSVLAPIKGERYIVPIFPYLAILSASVFENIRNKKIYLVLFIITMALSITSFLGSTWGKGPMKQSLVSLPFDLHFGQMRRIYLTTYSRPPYIYKMSGKEILDFIEEDAKVNKIKDPQILSLFYYRPLDEPLMTYNLYNEENPLQINDLVGTVIKDPIAGASYITGVIRSSDYVLTKTGKKVDENFSKINYRTLEATIKLFNQVNLSNYYHEERTVRITQDNSEVKILKRKGKISEEDLKIIEAKLTAILESDQ